MLAAEGASLPSWVVLSGARRRRLRHARRRSRATSTSRAPRSPITSTGSRPPGSSARRLDPDDRRVRRLELTEAGTELHAPPARSGDRASAARAGRDRAGRHGRARPLPRDRSRRTSPHPPRSVCPMHPEAGRDERPQVQRHRTVGDPLEVVRELLGHRGLVAAPHLREAGQPGPHHEPLPVGGQLVRELGEEPRPDRPRPDERHLAAQHVPELRDLVELRRLQPAPDPRVLELGPADELLAEVGPEPRLGIAASACGTSASGRSAPRGPTRSPRVEDGPAARDQHEHGDDRRDREQQQPEEQGEDDVERPQLDVDPAPRGLCREPPVTADERVLELLGCHDSMVKLRG